MGGWIKIEKETFLKTRPVSKLKPPPMKSIGRSKFQRRLYFLITNLGRSSDNVLRTRGVGFNNQKAYLLYKNCMFCSSEP